MSRIIAAANAGRQCVRCDADVHPPDPPHLCKDLRERQDRQDKAIRDIMKVLERTATSGIRDTAVAIYRAMSGRDLP